MVVVVVCGGGDCICVKHILAVQTHCTQLNSTSGVSPSSAGTHTLLACVVVLCNLHWWCFSTIN